MVYVRLDYYSIMFFILCLTDLYYVLCVIPMPKEFSKWVGSR